MNSIYQLPEVYEIAFSLRDIPREVDVLEEAARRFAEIEESGGGKVYDTLGLATQVMKTHGLDFILSSKMVRHFWGVARKHRPAEKDESCEKLLLQYRT